MPIGTPLPGAHPPRRADGTLVHGPGSGELYVSTPFQAAGYLDRSRDTGRSSPPARGRRPRTALVPHRDLVTRDERGLLHLTGRSDFQVKVRGVAVNTAEVERVLLTHPSRSAKPPSPPPPTR
ncbi:hypothetical protein [Kitasatospora sp. Ki12]